MKRLAFWLLLVLWASPVGADVVHLRNKRKLRGQIVRETQDAIVLRTPQGEIVVRRATVDRVEQESVAELYLGQARDAIRDQDYGTARQRFKLTLEALTADDPLRQQVEAELASAKRRSDPYLRKPTAGSNWTSQGPDPFEREEREARVREMMLGAQVRADLRAQVVRLLYNRAKASYESKAFLDAAIDFKRAAEFTQGDDARSLRGYEFDSRLKVASGAVRTGDAQLAAVAAIPVVNAGKVAGEDQFMRGSYLLGRAEELRQNRGAAAKAYRQALNGINVQKVQLPVLRELARLRAAGSNVNANTAGVAERWKWTQSRHFGIVRELETSDDELKRVLEAAFKDVVQRLNLNKTTGEQIAVFLFKDREGYVRSSGARGWSRAHASRLEGQDELVLSIYAYIGEGFEETLRHEIAHILIWRQLGDAVFPVWAGEGIAQYTEGEAERKQNRLTVQALKRAGQLPAWSTAIRQMLYPIQETQAALQAFYAQGGVMFELLAAQIGPRKAIAALARFNEEDPASVLRSVGLDQDAFLRSLESVSNSR